MELKKIACWVQWTAEFKHNSFLEPPQHNNQQGAVWLHDAIKSAVKYFSWLYNPPFMHIS